MKLALRYCGSSATSAGCRLADASAKLLDATGVLDEVVTVSPLGFIMNPRMR